MLCKTCAVQRSDDDSEPAASEGADSSGQPAGTGGRLHCRGAKQEDRVHGHSADTCCQPGCQQKGGRMLMLKLVHLMLCRSPTQILMQIATIRDSGYRCSWNTVKLPPASGALR